MKKQTTNNKGNILNDPEKRKRFKTALVTVTHYLQVIDEQKESIKETIDNISKEYGFDKKIIRKIANTMHKQNYSLLQEENHHFELLYETLVEGKLNTIPDPLDKNEDEEESEDKEELT